MTMVYFNGIPNARPDWLHLIIIPCTGRRNVIMYSQLVEAGKFFVAQSVSELFPTCLFHCVSLQFISLVFPSVSMPGPLGHSEKAWKYHGLELGWSPYCF